MIHGQDRSPLILLRVEHQPGIYVKIITVMMIIISLRLSSKWMLKWDEKSAANTKGDSYRDLLGYSGQFLHMRFGWSSVLRLCGPSGRARHAGGQVTSALTSRRVRSFVATAHRDVPPAPSIIQILTGPPAGLPSTASSPGRPVLPSTERESWGRPPAFLVSLLHLHRRCLQNALTTHLS